MPEHINKIKAIDPQIIVDGNIDKPYYSIRYYDTSDNIWHIGFSSYKLKFVVKWLKTEFDRVESEIEPVRHGKWDNNCNCSVCGVYKFEGLDADVWANWDINYCPNCGAKMDLGKVMKNG